MSKEAKEFLSLCLQNPLSSSHECLNYKSLLPSYVWGEISLTDFTSKMSSEKETNILITFIFPLPRGVAQINPLASQVQINQWAELFLPWVLIVPGDPLAEVVPCCEARWGRAAWASAWALEMGPGAGRCSVQSISLALQAPRSSDPKRVSAKRVSAKQRC